MNQTSKIEVLVLDITSAKIELEILRANLSTHIGAAKAYADFLDVENSLRQELQKEINKIITQMQDLTKQYPSLK